MEWRTQLRGAVYRGDGRAVIGLARPDLKGGAFRRFKDVLERTPDELDRWFSFSEERQRGRAQTWLADAGYKPLAVPN
jgi:Uncharacterised protein family (UPF0158)